MHGVRARRRIRAVRGLESQHSAKFDEAWPLPSIFAGDSKLQKVNAMLEKVGTLQVSGTGKVRVMPDEALVHFVVISDGKTAVEAVTSNARATQSTMDAVSAQPNHGVTTTGLSVNPIIKYEADISTVVGYRATNGVEVKTKIGYAGQVYDAGIAAGANQSSGITYQIQDETIHREEALRRAVEQAFKEAAIVAKAANIHLDTPESIQITSPSERVFYRATTVRLTESSTPTVPGELTITANVSVQFATRR